MIASDAQRRLIVGWRDKHAVRLMLLSREPDPYTVEGFTFESWRDASVARGKLQTALTTLVERLTNRITEIDNA